VFREEIDSLMGKWKGKRSQELLDLLKSGRLNPHKMDPDEQRKLLETLTEKLPKDLLPRDLKERLEGGIKHPSKLSPKQLEELQNWAKNNAAKLNPETSGSKNDDKTDNPTPERSSKPVPSEERPQGKAEQVSRGAIGPTLPDLNLSK